MSQDFEQQLSRMQAVVTATENIAHAAEADRESISLLLDRLKQVDSRVQSLLGQIPSTVEKSLSQLSEATAKKAAQHLTENFKDANAAASEATRNYRDASFQLSRKLWIGAALIQLPLLAIFAISCIWIIPSQSEIRERRQEVAELEFRALQAQMGNATVRSCDGRPCVRVDTTASKQFPDNYRVILGY